MFRGYVCPNQTLLGIVLTGGGMPNRYSSLTYTKGVNFTTEIRGEMRLLWNTCCFTWGQPYTEYMDLTSGGVFSI